MKGKGIYCGVKQRETDDEMYMVQNQICHIFCRVVEAMAFSAEFIGCL